MSYPPHKFAAQGNFNAPPPPGLTTPASWLDDNFSAAAPAINSVNYPDASAQALALAQVATDNGAIATTTLAAPNGSTLIGFLQAGTGATARTVSSKSQDWVSVKDFGAKGDGSTDDTAAVQAAFNTGSSVLIPEGLFSVSSVTFINSSGEAILFQGGSLIGRSGVTADAVLILKNLSAKTLFGRVSVSANYNTGYAAGIKIFTDDGSQASNLNIQNMAVVGALVAVQIGDPTYPSALCSEISFTGGFSYGCPTVIAAYGTQTVATFNGVNILADSLGGNTAWQAITQYGVRVFGANVIINGGEVIHAQTTTGADFCIEPIADPAFGHNYGTITCVGAEAESAAPLAIAQNSASVSSPVVGSGGITIIGSGGFHSQTSDDFIKTASDYSGNIIVQNCNFFCNSTRTGQNVNAAGSANIYVDAQSFGVGFIQGLKAITGGIVHFSARDVLNVNNTSSQTLAASTPTTLKFQTKVSGNDLNRFSGAYSTSTGQFTVPTGGLKCVKVEATFRTSAPTVYTELDFYVAGSLAGSSTPNGGGASSTGIVTGTLSLGDLAAGVTIEVKGFNVSGGTFNFAALEHMVINASN